MDLKRFADRKKLLFRAAAVVLLLLCLALVNDDSLYRQTIVRITAVSEEPLQKTEGETGVAEAHYRQSITGIVKNGEDKGAAVSFENEYTQSQASTTRYRTGDQLFVQLSHSGNALSAAVLGVKRDGWLAAVFLVFTCLLCLLYKGRGCLILLSVLMNAGLIFLALRYGDTEAFFSWQWPILIALFTVVTLLLVGGIRRQALGAIVSTLSTTFLVYLLYRLTVDRSAAIPYEMLPNQYAAVPVEAIYRFSVVAGCVGAIMDVCITMHTAVEKLTEGTEPVNAKAVFTSMRNIGADIMGTMINVLLFSYISSSLPLIVLKLNGGYSVGAIFSYDLIFDYTRFLLGAIGIVLAIPVSEGIALLFCRKDRRCAA